MIQIKLASQIPNRTFIAVPSSAWIDDYFEWSLEPRCCRQFDNGSFCGRDVEENLPRLPGPSSDVTTVGPKEYGEFDYSYGDENIEFDGETNVKSENVDFADPDIDEYDEYDYSYGDQNPLFGYDKPKTIAAGNKRPLKVKTTTTTKETGVLSTTPAAAERLVTLGDTLDDTSAGSSFITTRPVDDDSSSTMVGEKHMDDGWPDYQGNAAKSTTASGGSSSDDSTPESGAAESKKPNVDVEHSHHSGKHSGVQTTNLNTSPEISVEDAAVISRVRRAVGENREGIKRLKPPKKLCHSCPIEPMPHNAFRPDPQLFDEYLPMFLKDNPDMKCPKAGHAAYGQVCVQTFISSFIALSSLLFLVFYC